MIAFLDASALIYLIEGQPEVATSARSQLTCLAANHTDMAVGLSRLSSPDQ